MHKTWTRFPLEVFSEKSGAFVEFLPDSGTEGRERWGILNREEVTEKEERCAETETEQHQVTTVLKH